MKSNKDELYVKVIVLDEIYYFIANNLRSSRSLNTHYKIQGS